MDSIERNGGCVGSRHTEDYAAYGLCQPLPHRREIVLPRSMAHKAHGDCCATFLPHRNVVVVADQSISERCGSWRNGRDAEDACADDMWHRCACERSVRTYFFLAQDVQLTQYAVASPQLLSARLHMQARFLRTDSNKRKSYTSSKRSTRKLVGGSDSSTKSSKKNGAGKRNPLQSNSRRLIPQHYRTKSGKSNNSSRCNRLTRPSNNTNTAYSSRPCNFSKVSCSTRIAWRRTCHCLLCISHHRNKPPRMLSTRNNNRSRHRAAQENRTENHLLAY